VCVCTRTRAHARVCILITMGQKWWSSAEQLKNKITSDISYLLQFFAHMNFVQEFF